MVNDIQQLSEENEKLKSLLARCEKEKKQQEERHKLESLVSSISRRFINSGIGETDEIVNSALESLGEFTKVDRCYLFLYNEEMSASSCTHEWCAEGISAQINNLQNVSNDEVQWWTGKIFIDEVIYLESLDDLPPAASSMYEILASQSILSLLVVPINYGNAHIGFIGFDSVQSTKKWSDSDIMLLQMVADIMAGHFHNIQSVDQLRKSEEQYRVLMETTDDAVLVMDENGVLHYVNQAACRDYGKSENELVGNDLFGLYDEKFAREVLADVREVIASGQSLTKEYCFYYHSVERWYDVRIKRLFQDNQPLSRVLVFAIDVHDHKMREVKLEELNRQIQYYNDNLEALVEERTRENQELKNINEAIVEASGAMLISTNHEGIVETFNPMAEKLLGYKADEVVGKMSVLDLHCPEEVEKAVKLAEKQAGKTFSSQFMAMNYLIQNNPLENQEVTYVSKDGRRFPVLLSVTNIYAPDGTNLHSVGVAMDISVRKRAEETLKLQNELKSRFVSMASHEFRTPLSTILMAADLLDAHFHRMNDEEIHKKLGRIKSNVDFLKDMMERVLDLSHIESGKMPMKAAKENFSEFFEKQVLKFDRYEKSKKILLNSSTERLSCYFDRQMMKQVITNLLENAVKYSKDGVEIQVEMYSKDNQIVFTVSDHGIGIPEKDFPHVFDPFHRGTNVGSIRGTGLGLPLAREFVRLHGGDITF
ncbi:MAG: PAS domain S-box protein, partial [Marinilabiliaceae bacterium]